MNKDDKDQKNVDVKQLIPESILTEMSELHKDELQKQLDQIVEAKVAEKLDAAVKSSQVAYDAMMNERLIKVVNGLEANACRSLQEAADHLRAREQKHIAMVKEHYEKKIENIKKQSKAKYDRLVENVHTHVEKNTEKFRRNLTNLVLEFVETEVEKHLPVETIKESTRQKAALNLVKVLKRWLNVDEASSKMSLKKPLKEAVELIGEAKQTAKNLKTENEELKQKLNESAQKLEDMERDAFLAEKLASVPSINQRNYLKRVCEGCSKEWIAENFELSKKFFRETVNESREVLKQKTERERKPLKNNVSHGKNEPGRLSISRALNERREINKVPVINAKKEQPVLDTKQSRISQIVSQIEQDEKF